MFEVLIRFKELTDLEIQLVEDIYTGPFRVSTPHEYYRSIQSQHSSWALPVHSGSALLMSTTSPLFWIFPFLLFQNLLEQPGKPISFNEKYKHFIYLLTHIFWICNNEHLEHSSNKIFDLLNSDAFQTRKFTSGHIINLKDSEFRPWFNIE